MLNSLKLSLVVFLLYAHPVSGSENSISIFGIKLFSDVSDYFSSGALLNKDPHPETNEGFSQLWFTNPPTRNPTFEDYYVAFDDNNVVHAIGAAVLEVFEVNFCINLAEQWRAAFERRYGWYFQYGEGDGGGGIFVRAYWSSHERFQASIRCNQYTDGSVAFFIDLRSNNLEESINAFYDAF